MDGKREETRVEKGNSRHGEQRKAKAQKQECKDACGDPEKRLQNMEGKTVLGSAA